MGAHNAIGYGIGKDAQAAYNELVAREQYAYGHNPYAGTIAAKGGGFIPIALPPRLKLAKFEGLLVDYEVADGVEYAREEVQRAERDVRNAKPGTKRDAQKRLTAAKRRLATAEKDAERFRKRLAQAGLSEFHFERWHATWTDKWAEPLCVELRGKQASDVRQWRGVKRGKVYAFLGMVPT